MMKISMIEIKRFRSILSLSIEINTKNNFITICGANNTGKTNVLKALNLFFNPTAYSVSEDSPNHKYYGSRGGKAYPEITITFDDSIFKYQITKEFGSENLVEITGKKTAKTDSKKLDIDEINQLMNQFAFFFIPSINISFPELINNLIDDVYDLEYQKTRFRGLKQELKNSFDNYINGLVEILNQLAVEINPAFQEFNENWTVGFENTSDIQKFKDLISEDVVFYLNDKSNRSIEGKGSGLQRLGFILLHSRIIQKLTKKNVIFCIDEPDVFLHQELQRKLKTHLLEIANNCQIILTSHSPVFIDSYKLDNVFLLDLQIGEATTYQRTGKTFYPLSTTLVNLFEYDGHKKIKDYLGIRSEDYDLLDSYNIIVEGDSDKKYIVETCNYFGISTSKVIAAHGVTKIEKYLEFYDSFYAGRDLAPKILVILDNDLAGREEYRKLFKKVNANTYRYIKALIEFIPNCFGDIPNHEDIMNQKIKSNFEIEDFIYPEILLDNANEILKKKNFITMQFAQLEKKISANAFKEKGVLFNIDLIKNENNTDQGHLIDFSTEQVKEGLSNLYNLQGNKLLSNKMMDLDTKYPNVKKYLMKIMDAEVMTKQFIF